MILYRLLCLLILSLLCSPSSAQDKAAATGTTSGNWRLVGPKEPMQDSEGGDIGRIGSFALHPKQPHTIYAGTPSGGLWHTQDDGATWDQLGKLPELGISDIAIDPLTPDTIYVMTGDVDNSNNHGPPSIGVFKSVDGGRNWAPTGLTFKPADRIWGTRLVINPATPSILLAATWRGLFRTTDGGKTWSQVTVGILLQDRTEFWDIQFHPTNPSIVYAASTTAVYRSTNAGQTWSALHGGLPPYAELCYGGNCRNPNYSNRISLAVTAKSPDTLYVLYGSATGFTIGLYRSDDRGNTFTKRSSTLALSKDRDAPPPLDLTKPNILGYDDSDFGQQSSYTLAIAVSPTNADVVRVGAVDTWESRDGGQTWQRTSRWNYDPGDRRYVHADVHKLVDRGDALFAGTDGGIYRSSDDGQTWDSITKMKTGVTIAQIYHVCLSEKEPDTLYYGAQDNGTYRLKIDGEILRVYGGDGFVCQVDPQHPNTLYVEYAYGDIRRTDDAAHPADNLYAHVTPTVAGRSISGSWLTPYILAPDDPNTIYACYADVWRSTDRGLSWTNLTHGVLGPSLECRAIAVSPSDPKTIYVAKEAERDPVHNVGYQQGDPRPPFLGGGGVFRSSDGGASWQSLGATLPLAEAAVTNLAVSPTDPQRAWVTFGGYNPDIKVYETRNGGANWAKQPEGLPPNYQANAVAADAGPNNPVYLGTDDGVYYRDDRLNAWTPFKDNLPNVVTTMLLVDKPRNRIFAATFGHGVWVSDLHAP